MGEDVYVRKRKNWQKTAQVIVKKIILDKNPRKQGGVGSRPQRED